jgi:hypothetical protein
MEPLFSSVRYFQVLVWSRYLRPPVCCYTGIDMGSYMGVFLFGTWSLIWDRMREKEIHRFSMKLVLKQHFELVSFGPKLIIS